MNQQGTSLLARRRNYTLLLREETLRFHVALRKGHATLLTEMEKLARSLIHASERAPLLGELLACAVCLNVKLITVHPSHSGRFFAAYAAPGDADIRNRINEIQRVLTFQQIQQVKAGAVKVTPKLTSKKNIVFLPSPRDDLSGLVTDLAELDFAAMIDALNGAQNAFVQELAAADLKHLNPACEKMVPARFLVILEKLLQAQHEAAGSRGQDVVPPPAGTQLENETDSDVPGL